MEIDQSIFDHACDLYAKGASMATISRELKLSNTAVRKIMITAGLYKSDMADRAQAIAIQHPDLSLDEIARRIGRSAGYTNSLLPYKKGMYNIANCSPAAAKTRRCREKASVSAQRAFEEFEHMCGCKVNGYKAIHGGIEVKLSNGGKILYYPPQI